MGRLVYLSGRFVAEEEASIPLMDRGLLFADAVYEGMGVLDGQITDFRHHMARLKRSLGELSMPEPMTEDEIWHVLMRLVEHHEVEEGFLYLHVTRGVAERDYAYARAGRPEPDPTVFAFTQPKHGFPAEGPIKPLALASYPDLRWARRDIKTTNLLGQVMAKQHAASVGVDEALLVRPDGEVNEAGSRSFFIVVDGAVVLRPMSNDILPGVTRRALVAVANDHDGIRLDERTYTLDEVFAADEAFTTGASSYVEPVTEVDGRVIGDGNPGPVTLKLLDAYLRYARQSFYRPAD